nr:hypothetical protein [Tanacetum cinerariifolium]
MYAQHHQQFSLVEEVIVNGDSPLPKRTVDGVEHTYPLTTAEEKLARKNEFKARESVSSTNKNQGVTSLLAELELCTRIFYPT